MSCGSQPGQPFADLEEQRRYHLVASLFCCPQEGASRAPLEAEKGAKRLRRTIVTTHPDGSKTQRELIITSPDKVHRLALLFT